MDEPQTKAPEDWQLTTRPTGRAFIIAAWICAASAVLCIFISMVTDAATPSGGINETNVDIKANALLLGEALAALWLALLPVGYIIRAIWFLPGEESKLRP